MGRLGVLIRGELDRLKKYNLFTATSVVLVMWLILVWFLDTDDQILTFIPIILLMDAVMMTIVLVGATLFYEKKEHTLNSIMVTPVQDWEYIVSKIVVNVINSLITVVALSVGVYLIAGITFNYLLLTAAMIVVTGAHTLIGIWLAYHAKNFSSMLVNYIIYVFVLVTPTVLAMFDVIGETAAKFLILLPPDASNILLGAAFRTTEAWQLVVAFVYLIVLSGGIYRFVVKPQLNAYAMRETGV
jgi:fluoroquinolone transport system permease protein